jgi:hypothetical protein
VVKHILYFVRVARAGRSISEGLATGPIFSHGCSRSCIAQPPVSQIFTCICLFTSLSSPCSVQQAPLLQASVHLRHSPARYREPIAKIPRTTIDSSANEGSPGGDEQSRPRRRREMVFSRPCAWPCDQEQHFTCFGEFCI